MAEAKRLYTGQRLVWMRRDSVYGRMGYLRGYGYYLNGQQYYCVQWDGSPRIVSGVDPADVEPLGPVPEPPGEEPK